MGWKTSNIIINSDKEIDQEEVLNRLGYKNLKKATSKTFEEVMLPSENEVYITKYKGNWIICDETLPLKSFEESLSEEEKILTTLFPDSEICSIALQSTVNFWGYAISKNNKKMRVRAGTSDEGTFINKGEPLKQEESLLSKSELNDKGERIYFFEDFPDEPFSEDQVGENFVFELTSRYFGEQLDADDELFETVFDGYNFSNNLKTRKERKISSALETLNKETKPNNQWVKYVVITIIIIIVKIILRNL